MKLKDYIDATCLQLNDLVTKVVITVNVDSEHNVVDPHTISDYYKYNRFVVTLDNKKKKVR